MDDAALNLAELDDVDLYMLLIAATVLFPKASEERVFRQITEEAQRRGWTTVLDPTVARWESGKCGPSS